jgi:hypothetical protein
MVLGFRMEMKPSPLERWRLGKSTVGAGGGCLGRRGERRERERKRKRERERESLEALMSHFHVTRASSSG